MKNYTLKFYMSGATVNFLFLVIPYLFTHC